MEYQFEIYIGGTGSAIIDEYTPEGDGPVWFLSPEDEAKLRACVEEIIAKAKK